MIPPYRPRDSQREEPKHAPDELFCRTCGNGPLSHRPTDYELHVRIVTDPKKAPQVYCYPCYYGARPRWRRS